jgi:ribosome modulation factor
MPLLEKSVFLADAFARVEESGVTFQSKNMRPFHPLEAQSCHLMQWINQL